ncbi:ABC transporter ATP-binding protein [bacterium]|nr:ABC transporter ATP-binding protein [bacterium]
MTDIVIKTENLTKEYVLGIQRKTRVLALDHLSIEVNKGETFGLLGPNGSGKTTTLKLLLGFISPSEGQGWILSKQLGNIETKNRIGYLSEVSYLYSYLTAWELLDFCGSLFGIASIERKRRIAKILDLVGLTEKAHIRLSSYSKGMLQRAALAQTLINDPDLLLLDEPTSGLDPIGQREMRDVFLKLKEQGKTLFLCSHQLSEAELICDRIGILHKGRLNKIGKLDDLLIMKHAVKIRAMNIDKETHNKLNKIPEISIGENETDKDMLEISLDEHLINTVIDILRSNNSQILSVMTIKRSLEEIFVEAVENNE